LTPLHKFIFHLSAPHSLKIKNKSYDNNIVDIAVIYCRNMYIAPNTLKLAIVYNCALENCR